MAPNMTPFSSTNANGRFQSPQSLGKGSQSQFKTSSPSSVAQDSKTPNRPGGGDVHSSSGGSSHGSSADESKAPFIGPIMEKFGKGGGGVRSIGEKLEVNPSNGTMSLSIPIHTSTGRSGFGPSLSLGYDSGSGNCPFGIGWSLSADSITRKVSCHSHLWSFGRSHPFWTRRFRSIWQSY